MNSLVSKGLKYKDQVQGLNGGCFGEEKINERNDKKEGRKG